MIKKNWTNIHQAVNAHNPLTAEQKKGIHTIAVSKKQPDERIEEALESGIRVFGENRVQEAQQRWAERRSLYPDLSLHLIGPLQSNKAADAVALFDVIHTVDREKIVRSLAKEMQKQNRSLPCFIQVNTGREEQKSGIDVNQLEDFLVFCNDHDLNIIGLMAIPPINDPAAFHFALLKKWADKFGLKRLSMGMSQDWETALRHGATDIRIGSALFGERPKN